MSNPSRDAHASPQRASSAAVTTAAEVKQFIRSDTQLTRWKMIDGGADYIEIEVESTPRQFSYLALVWPNEWQDPELLKMHLVRARTGNFHLVLFGSDDQFEASEVDKLTVPQLTVVRTPVNYTRLGIALHAAATTCGLRQQAAHLELELARARYENDMLISIGRALSQQRDLRSLLELILARACEVTGADAGSVYVVEGVEEPIGQRRLRFTASRNDSIAIPSSEFTMPVSATSIVGFCVITREPIRIPDLYKLDPPGTGNNIMRYVHDRSFDEKNGYQSRSILAVPMISARQRVIGVIQLINKRARGWYSLTTPSCFNNGVAPFDDVSEKYASSLASQAGIALENAQLYEEVRASFEGFVHASVSAIESRDPTTSGHSERVAVLTVELAKVAADARDGAYAGFRLSDDDLKQIEYAALLHDFGKVGVRENVLVKAKKLYEHQRQLIIERFEFIRQALENQTLASKLAYLTQDSRERRAAEIAGHMAGLEAELAGQIGEIDEFVRFILAANEPTVLEQGGFERIASIAARRYVDATGVEQRYLTEDEALALQIGRGSLTQDERREIESHVVHTFEFLKKIPWGRTFSQVPMIAGAHHEKLDGSGYPDGLAGDAIPVPARMMTIADIYDALTAADRPYKKAVPTDRALDILQQEVSRGKLDAELFELFVGAKVFTRSGKKKR